ncbi:hypothetical protein ARMSODRAFT_399960 [Armillaria solidipes]|uniref:Uncharacterized protein n=1 Tax=Armillaria solidipes TaxID=1076256 RepID=A0A2H3C2X6_9AGAR|nr:hypothetical protein ARMSODRAFT_399960 [Armillaria solidipes]
MGEDAAVQTYSTLRLFRTLPLLVVMLFYFAAVWKVYNSCVVLCNFHMVLNYLPTYTILSTGKRRKKGRNSLSSHINV